MRFFWGAMAVLASCSAPSVRAIGQHGEVTVPERMGTETAMIVSDSVDRLAPQVARFLGVPLSQDISVRVHDNPRIGHAYGRVASGRIDLGSVSVTSREMLNFALAHELAHLHMQDEPFSRLPYPLEEGIAEFIGLMFGPDGALQARKAEWADIPPDPGILEVTPEDYSRMDRPEREKVIRGGFVLAERIGFSTLIEMAKQGRLDRDSLLAAMNPDR